MKPKQIEILGEGKSLDEVVDGFAGIEKAIERNKYRYRRTWDGFVPPTNGGRKDFHVAYRPLVCMKQVFPEIDKSITELPYFMFVVNLGRDLRPHDKKAKQKKQKQENQSHEEKCPVCKNLLAKEMIISEFGDFYLTPNGFPYHYYSSLLIDKNVDKKQDKPTIKDISEWMRFSILTGQCVFYNTFGAGATIKHQHAQVVDPEIIKSGGRIISYPLLNKTTKRKRIARGIERVTNYPVDVVVYKGRDAPFRAHHLSQKLMRKGRKYNLIMNDGEIFVMGRSPKNEVSPCIGKKVGAYELLGVVLLGNIEEPVLGKKNSDRVVEGSELFNTIPFERIEENLEFASISLEGFL